ncbi:hypothetical protein BpHYR1_013245 [Brachionus plicatilis]|uniref:Uncharacterized protein n=1 Tax=Brachionus plicatilis TaxID=10195 RepID=A0A3M7S182_BRAPC|nr:hypothetical protein BpHYR1_013245 [Brachionus plicatilis]
MPKIIYSLFENLELIPVEIISETKKIRPTELIFSPFLISIIIIHFGLSFISIFASFFNFARRPTIKSTQESRTTLQQRWKPRLSHLDPYQHLGLVLNTTFAGGSSIICSSVWFDIIFLFRPLFLTSTGPTGSTGSISTGSTTIGSTTTYYIIILTTSTTIRISFLTLIYFFI